MRFAGAQGQLFEELDSIRKDLEALSQSGQEERGAVFTKVEVVEFILDLIGYTTGKKLYRRRILEPCFGHGDFLLPLLDRLLTSVVRDHDPVSLPPEVLAELNRAVRAVELHEDSVRTVERLVMDKLCEAGFRIGDARALVQAWIVHDDFLLAEFEVAPFEFVAGNPPYVRQEMIPTSLLTEYRRRFSTMYDRADLYVAFFERSLDLLAAKGSLGFICADRWTKNKYGGPLRAKIGADYHLAHFIEMTDVAAFKQEVSAYPAVTVIRRAESGPTRVAFAKGELDRLSTLGRQLVGKPADFPAEVQEISLGAPSRSPWILTGDSRTKLLQKLEAEFPTLEGAGCKIGIGVASGADKIYIQSLDELDVEPSRKLPLATTRDIVDGKIEWRGLGVVNPFLENGKLATFEEFPRMARFFETHKDAIMNRNVAKKNRANWYRTIDRIYPSLGEKPKLLIPDIRGDATIVLENQGLYPHHNFYFITSEDWPLEALQAALLAGLARLFVEAYTTKMRGGYLRYQAQHLRRIRIPGWDSIPKGFQKTLQEASRTGDNGEFMEALTGALGLQGDEKDAFQGYARD